MIGQISAKIEDFTGYGSLYSFTISDYIAVVYVCGYNLLIMYGIDTDKTAEIKPIVDSTSKPLLVL